MSVLAMLAGPQAIMVVKWIKGNSLRTLFMMTMLSQGFRIADLKRLGVLLMTIMVMVVVLAVVMVEEGMLLLGLMVAFVDLLFCVCSVVSVL